MRNYMMDDRSEAQREGVALGLEGKGGLAPTLRRACLALAPFLVVTPQLYAQDRIQALDAQSIDWFGFDVASHGDLSVVGSWRDDDKGESTGSAHVVYTPGFGNSGYLSKLVLRDARAGDLAGMSVAIGEGVILVAAPGRVIERADGTTITGTVAVFEQIDGAWVQVAELDDPTRSEGDLFGNGIAVSDAGILVGAPRDDTSQPDGGAVYAFERQSNGWNRVAKLVPEDNSIHDFFGHDVAANGETAVVGAFNDDDAGVNAGAAYTLERFGDGWSIEQKLTAQEGAGFDSFGTSVSIYGDTIVVSAPQNEDTDDLAVGNEGAAIVYERSPLTANWVETTVLRPGGPNADYRFGIDVAVGSDMIVVGAASADTGLLNSGSAHVFKRRSRDWFEVECHEGTTPQAFAYVGLSVSVGANVVVIGAPGADHEFGPGVGVGAIDVFPRNESATPFGSSFCHSDEESEGFANLGGMRNRIGELGRLTVVGKPSVTNGTLHFRMTGLEPGLNTILVVGFASDESFIGDARFCVNATSNRRLLATGSVGVPENGRFIVRDFFSRAENAVPGITMDWPGLTLYAQGLYFTAGREFFTTNAMAVELTN